MSFERPDFIGRGVFLWNELGYSFSEAPPSELLDDASVHSENPWIAAAAVLQRAKAGDFTNLPILAGCMRRSDSWVLAQACADLLGDAGSATCLRGVLDEFSSDLFEDDDIRFQVNLSYTCSNSGLLWTIPIMLEIYLRARDDEEAGVIPRLLSRTLEARYGPIANVPAETSSSQFRETVMQRYHELCTRFGSDAVPVRFGERFSVRELLVRLNDKLTRVDAPAVTIAQERHQLEAATGLDCRDFFSESGLRRLSAAAIVEEFMESSESANYEDGVRYFFSHRIENT